jgi:hypothetical protein
LLVVVVAQRLRDFAEGECALSAGLAFQNENESLSAYGTTHIGGIRGGFAQNLHTAFTFRGVGSSRNRATPAHLQASQPAQAGTFMDHVGLGKLGLLRLEQNRFTANRTSLARRKSRLFGGSQRESVGYLLRRKIAAFRRAANASRLEAAGGFRLCQEFAPILFVGSKIQTGTLTEKCVAERRIVPLYP